LAEGGLVGNYGQDLFITYTAGDGNDVALFTLASISGDFDFDDDVDGADFLIWQRDPSAGDRADWQANFGHAPATSVAAVPEPASALLGLLIFAGLMGWGRAWRC
jgi:hypothetical protein